MNQETPAPVPVSDAVRQALAVTERGCEELIPQADWLRKLVRSEQTGQPLPELSMGMTDDFPIALAEGATMVRVGRAVFGERNL
jgi:tyrosyl-tRNA synthetase